MNSSFSLRLFLFSLMTSLLTANSFSQSEARFNDDPLKGFTHFSEISIHSGVSRINTQITQFSSEKGDYSLGKNMFRATAEANFFWGWILKDKTEKEIYALKTGFGLMGRSAAVTDSNQAKLSLVTSYLQVPLILSFREPIKYQSESAHFYKAVDFGIGFYAATPLGQVLRERNDLDKRLDENQFNYLRFGFIAEISLSFFDQKGRGHKLGIRSTTDFNTFTKFQETTSEIYPVYNTITLFYNLENEYWKKDK